MTTNFFSTIASLKLAGTWKLAIETDTEGNFTVSELFAVPACGDKAADRIAPLTLKGTAQELDEGFFDTVTQPVLKAAGLQTNMEAHLKSVEAAKAASKMEQDKKNKDKGAGSAPKKTGDIEIPEVKTDKKRLYDEAMKNILLLNDEMKYEEAIALLPAITDYPDKENELKAKRADLLRKNDLKRQAYIAFNA